MLRLIASDIDGTLLQNGAKVLPTELFDEICRLKKQGILFCPASGRQYHSLRQLFAPVADRIPFICENGAVVFGPGDPGPVLGKTVMDRRLAVELCRGIMALPEVEVLISGANTSYLCPKRESFVSEVRDGLGNSAVVVERPEDVPEDIIRCRPTVQAAWRKPGLHWCSAGSGRSAPPWRGKTGWISPLRTREWA